LDFLGAHEPTARERSLAIFLGVSAGPLRVIEVDATCREGDVRSCGSEEIAPWD